MADGLVDAYSEFSRVPQRKKVIFKVNVIDPESQPTIELQCREATKFGMVFSVWIKTDECYFNKPRVGGSRYVKDQEMLPFVDTASVVRLDDPNSLDMLVGLGWREIIKMNLKAIAEELKFELAGEEPDPDAVFAIDELTTHELTSVDIAGYQLVCVYKNTSIFRITLTDRDISFHAPGLGLARRIFQYDDPKQMDDLIRLAGDLILISKEEMAAWERTSGVGPALRTIRIRRKLLKKWGPWSDHPPEDVDATPF